MSELPPPPPNRLQPPLFPGTLKKLIKGKTLNAKCQSGNTGWRDEGMANGRDVEDQRIDLSTKISAAVPHGKYLFWDVILLLIAISVRRTLSSLPPPQETSFYKNLGEYLVNFIHVFRPLRADTTQKVSFSGSTTKKYLFFLFVFPMIME